VNRCLALLLLTGIVWIPAACAADAIEIRIQGIEEPLLENVLALLSLKRHARSKELDEELVGRLTQRAPGEVGTALRPYGYYEPAIHTELTRNGAGWLVIIRIDPGPPVILVEQQIEITGSGRDESLLQQVLAHSPLRTGKRLSHVDYDQLKGDLFRAAAGSGYLDAEFIRSELLVDPAAREARARITFETGGRYRFGPTVIEQNFLRADLVKRYLRYREGDWYDAGALLRTQFALDDSQYFAVVEVLPEERDRMRRIAPIRITSGPNKRNRYTIAAGYATDTLTRGTLGWENRRV
jgi:translocation and assembly module TamA